MFLIEQSTFFRLWTSRALIVYFRQTHLAFADDAQQWQNEAHSNKHRTCTATENIISPLDLTSGTLPRQSVSHTSSDRSSDFISRLAHTSSSDEEDRLQPSDNLQAFSLATINDPDNGAPKISDELVDQSEESIDPADQRQLACPTDNSSSWPVDTTARLICPQGTVTSAVRVQLMTPPEHEFTQYETKPMKCENISCDEHGAWRSNFHSTIGSNHVYPPLSLLFVLL